jgi:nucleotide-binding universal stress UspA family protein
MEKYKVLVPVDGSPFCRQIIPILTRFISPETNELILLRVGEHVGGLLGAPPRPAGLDGMVLTYETENDARLAAHPIFASQVRDSVAADFLAEMRKDAHALEDAGFTVRYEMRFGNPGEQIVNYVNTHDIDLIAMTTHWRTGVNRLLYGNTVQYVTPRVTAPLLMLRPAEELIAEAA